MRHQEDLSSHRHETHEAIILKRNLTIPSPETAHPRLHKRRRREMAEQMMTKGMTPTDRIVGWALMAGLVLVLLGYAQSMALPAHFV